jgi:hypothetical protein
MSANTPDQQITYPVGTDVADNPQAFLDMLADVETRLVLKYTNEADRAARHTAPVEGDLTGLATENRYDVYTGAAYVSLESRGYHFYVRRTADSAAVNNSTALVSDPVLVGSLTTGGTYQWQAGIFYDSSTIADIKFAFTTPTFVAGNMRWVGMGLATTATTNEGDMKIATITASGTSTSWGGIGTGTTIFARIEGFITATSTANLQFQFAQQNLDPTNTIVRTGSYLRAWRVS